MKFTKIKKKIFIGLFWMLLVVSFVFFAGIVHLKANGWQLDYRTGKLTKTGMIYLSGTPRDSIVKINSLTSAENLPFRVSNLIPASYDVMVERKDYHFWHKTISIEPGRAYLEENIILFLIDPIPVNVAVTMTKEDLQKEYEKQSSKIEIIGSELYYDNTLISRFSQDILGAVVYPDNRHFVFQQNNEIRVIDLDGSNNQLLFKLNTSSPSIFILKDDGQTLYYQEGDQILAKTIR